MGSGELPAVERRWLERVVRATIKIEAVIEVRPDQDSISSSPSVLSNAEIADRLASLAQLLSSQKENPYKVKAYQRAASRIRNLSESLDEMVRDQEDLTRFAGIGEAIASAVREIVTTGTLGKLEKLRAQVTPAVASITSHPRLDPKRVIRVYEKLVFVVESDDFPGVVARMQRYGGRTPLISSGKDHALFSLSSGILLRLQLAGKGDWGFHMVACTGSKFHLKKLTAATGPVRELEWGKFKSEAALYRKYGLRYIEPELREGHDEVARAKAGTLPVLVSAKDIRGDFHAHSMSSDGANSIEDMADAAQERGYDYIGITDHSQSLKIARGVSAEDLWAQIRFIDKVNGKLRGFRILKSSEVDILADGSLDYSDELLKELDYTVCSIHSRFALTREAQTERILRAMDNPYFNILGHATGRLLLKRPGYEIDIERVIAHARQNGCFFEMNSSPDRLDLSAENARSAAAAGVLISISTDSHSTGELDLIRCGIDQARRAGLQKADVLNCRPWEKLQRLFRR